MWTWQKCRLANRKPNCRTLTDYDPLLIMQTLLLMLVTKVLAVGLLGLGCRSIPGTCRTGIRLVSLVQVYLPDWPLGLVTR